MFELFKALVLLLSEVCAVVASSCYLGVVDVCWLRGGGQVASPWPRVSVFGFSAAGAIPIWISARDSNL